MAELSSQRTVNVISYIMLCTLADNPRVSLSMLSQRIYNIESRGRLSFLSFHQVCLLCIATKGRPVDYGNISSVQFVGYE